MIKECSDELIPVITEIVNASITNSEVPVSMKNAFVRPLLKKANLDPNILKNFRPVSNLSYLSKIIEKVVAARLTDHMNKNNLMEPRQSAYRRFHSTESALLRVQNDLLMALENKKMVALVLLDLSAAFDTLDHNILLNRLSTRCGIKDDCLLWFKSYLSNRCQIVSINRINSEPKQLPFGVPQGSVLGPILFTIYTIPVGDIARKYNLGYHFYADDSQLYIYFDPKKTADMNLSIHNLEQCINEIRIWMKSNLLKLNNDKTEVLLLGSTYHLKIINSVNISVGSSMVTSKSSVGNLGSIFDSRLTMLDFITKKCKICMFYLYSIRRIRKYLTTEATKDLIHALITSRLDYGNCLLFGLPKCQIKKLQRVQNFCARVIYNARKYDHVSPLLKELHWLPVYKRIEFKLLCYTYNCYHGLSTNYLNSLIKQKSPTSMNLRSNNNYLLDEKLFTKSFGKRAFENCAPSLWNSLPVSLRSSSTLSLFKKHLKTFLFENHFCQQL